jgi:hypothetical protein
MDTEIWTIHIAVRESLSAHMARHGKHVAREAAGHARDDVRLPTCGVVVTDAVDVAGLRNRWSLSQTVLAHGSGSDITAAPV